MGPTKTKDALKKKNAAGGAEAEHIYATINKELEMVLSGSDKIIFGPSENFEYTAPLEDFFKSKKGGSSAE
ncbi:MAG: hypothetical protein A3C93_03970 [Candidatus Lloydbacteria bacterium RIFCSPHIGHO2_02_FULL_54_17]|uniref:Uncharacterized protein n=1 Tax=Candidatus Lloydbacteria bacterium RIFCSPHIGHO2_02_FULL_54_17 TaxID=1798664 RepID=A0A1G2DF82_9BACT|nr:MAG: hypothetical protein A2762_03445 [Candidatus Lloydbacteria bacterium RIFCSPHIGHO2_01_FULL_54_11]OGZ12269.1 MAG: hypothetical protein A3C93_03970 [Candidatus Lloydbacteria bacterium RIFCSPHIGHO2_02_FULL_54_17]OGZ13972.1 MAG: hypothetical protein A2948_00620 [Candidatus Lloydbacteria bacterium RIFCSPLOWO2_01_FULL_54_18]OGZ16423.1 MAG: hypothetical protein A3H76_05360 [Candidatus Lloydbacteria bacterium RIFCSPLOWO2_02_FULL_54_12]